MNINGKISHPNQQIPFGFKKKKRITNIEIPAKRIKERKSVKQVKHVLLHKGILKLRLRNRETFFFLSEELSNTSDADTFSNKHFTASIEFVIHLILFNVTSDKNKEMNKITH